MKLNKKTIITVLLTIAIIISACVVYLQKNQDEKVIDYGNTPEERLNNGDPACANRIAC